MRFQIGCELDYEVKTPSVLIFNVHASRGPSQQVLEESLAFEPYVKHDEFISQSGDSRFVRVDTGEAKRLKVAYRALVETSYELIDAGELERVPVQRLDHSLVTYLFPSRYCQSDRLARLAYGKFGKIDNAYRRVVAITEWIHENVEYARGSTNAQTSAYDTVTERAGVCRDFAHLGIALCRALNIPARYFTGYAYELQPADFHACFEAYIGNRWVIFDATRLSHLNGLVRIGNGRDAADSAVATIFGQVSTPNMQVTCVPADEGFQRLEPATLAHKGVCLEAAAA